ncbi:MAG TPA: SAM-dependent methyltransferase [Porticoccus sp.]|nr:SAM-dependent methyltransferase [Porticoccus sp.]
MKKTSPSDALQTTPLLSPMGIPDAWIIKFAPLVPKGQILDLACGRGRHGRYFLNQNYPVTFLDQNISGVADLENHPKAKLMQYDLETPTPGSGYQEKGVLWPFDVDLFSGIVVSNYLHRPLFPYLLQSLKPGAVLLYKTFSQGNEQFGKPSNPAFLLHENELRDVFEPALDIVDFRQGKESNPDRITQAICAIKKSR